MGSGHTVSLKFDLEIIVVASGFFKSLPNLAKVLQKETPTEIVKPVSFFTLARILSAIVFALPNKFIVLVMSIQHSSNPKLSTLSLYSLYILWTFLNIIV